jgi:hypothetical protein
MNRLFVLYALLTLTLIGCTSRHVVVDPDEMADLDKGTWTITKEPNDDLNQYDLNRPEFIDKR